MPNYLYRNTITNKVIEVFQHMNDVHEYTDESGVKYERVFTKPNAAFDTVAIDPYSAKDYVKATNKEGCTVGDLLDRSAELHEKRKDKEGKDPFREQFYKDYQKEHKGRKHHAQQREETTEALKGAGIEVEYPD
jgi:hypothetical protein